MSGELCDNRGVLPRQDDCVIIGGVAVSGLLGDYRGCCQDYWVIIGGVAVSE